MMARPCDLPLVDGENKSKYMYNSNEIRYLLIPASPDFQMRDKSHRIPRRARANSGVVLPAAGFDNIPPPSK